MKLLDLGWDEWMDSCYTVLSDVYSHRSRMMVDRIFDPVFQVQESVVLQEWILPGATTNM